MRICASHECTNCLAPREVRVSPTIFAEKRMSVRSFRMAQKETYACSPVEPKYQTRVNYSLAEKASSEFLRKNLLGVVLNGVEKDASYGGYYAGNAERGQEEQNRKE